MRSVLRLPFSLCFQSWAKVSSPSGASQSATGKKRGGVTTLVLSVPKSSPITRSMISVPWLGNCVLVACVGSLDSAKPTGVVSSFSLGLAIPVVAGMRVASFVLPLGPSTTCPGLEGRAIGGSGLTTLLGVAARSFLSRPRHPRTHRTKPRKLIARCPVTP